MNLLLQMLGQLLRRLIKQTFFCGGMLFYVSVYAQDLSWFNQIKDVSDDIDINDLVVDPTGNLYIGGSFDDQTAPQVNFMGSVATTTHEQMGFIAKLNSSGTIQWMDKFGSTQSTTGYSPLSMVVKNGYLYVVGSYEYSAAPGLDFDPGAGTSAIQSGGNVDMFVSKYNASTGALVWAYKCSGSNGSDLATGITIDNSENIYVTGFVNNGASACDFNIKSPGAPAALGTASKQHVFLAKYTKDCDFVWRTNVTNSSTTPSVAIAIDTINSYIYIGGGIAQVGGVNPSFSGVTLSCTAGAPNECFLAQYSFSGTCNWVKNTGRITSNSLSNLIRSIDIDGAGNIYVSGTLGSTSDFDPSAGTSSLSSVGSFDGFVAKYNSACTLQWKYGIGSTSFGEAIHSIDVTPSGDIVIGGALHGQAEANPEGTGGSRLVGTTGTYGIFFGQYDTDFKYQWAYGITDASATVIGNEANVVAIDESTAAAPVYVYGYMHAAPVTQNFNPSGGGVFAPSLVPETGTGAAGGNNANGFLAKYSTTIVLPVELVSFDARCSDKNITFNWETTTELNNNYFLLQESDDAINWLDITQIEGSGNSYTNRYYSYTINYTHPKLRYYRLIQTDLNGRGRSSKIISVNCSQTDDVDFKIYPNPAQNILNFTCNKFTSATIKIYNLSGQLLKEEYLINQKEQRLHSVNIKELNPGLYIVQVLGNEININTKFIKN